MLKIAIYSQKRDKESLDYIKEVVFALKKKGVDVFIFGELKNVSNVFNDHQIFNSKTDLEKLKIDYFFTFGGDGTILNALSLIQNLEIPVVGVNMGRLGFLASFTREGVLDSLNDIFSENTQLSKRSVIEVKSRNNSIDFPYALNDITITRKETTSMITVEAKINGEFLTFFWGDGLIVATPSGSTAYSLSCGGPIIEPGNDNFSLTPMAPHNLNMRPIILKDNVEITLKVSSRVPEYSLGLDSRLYHMSIDDELILRKAKFSLNLIMPKNVSFYETLRQKLLWGNDKRN